MKPWKNLGKVMLVVCLGLLAGLSPWDWASSLVEAKVITDQLGRQVKVPEMPRRVIALAPSLTEIIFALGREQQLKGVTQFSDYPPAAQSQPKVGSYIHLDLERIVALRPDLCIGIKDGNPQYVVARLSELQIPVYLVDPRNLEGVMNTILEIGKLLGAKKRAQALVADMHRRIERVRHLVAQTHSRPKVFFQIGVAPIISVGNHTFANELISLAGGENVAAGPIAYPRFSREKVLARRPEVIIITSMARGEAFNRVKAQWSSWPDLPAAAQHRIFLVDSDIFDRPTPRLVTGLELLCRLIHPELAPKLGESHR